VNHQDIGRLLAYIAAFDKRTVGAADVLAWHDVLGDLDFDAAKEAVRKWYADNDGMIMPAHVRRGSKSGPPALLPAAEVLADLDRLVAADRRPFALDGLQVGREIP
jgi:hypothetical protein